MPIAIDAISYAQLHEQLVQCEADGNAMAAENARLRAALTTTRIYIKDEMIASAVVVPPDAKPPFDGCPSLLQVIDAALQRNDEQSSELKP